MELADGNGRSFAVNARGVGTAGLPPSGPARTVYAACGARVAVVEMALQPNPTPAVQVKAFVRPLHGGTTMPKGVPPANDP